MIVSLCSKSFKLQQYVKWELQIYNWILKGRGVRDKIANIQWIMEKTKEWQKDIYLCSIDNMKYFDCGD